MLVSLLSLDDSEQLSLTVSVESPRIVVKSEEAMTIEIFIVSLGMNPFMIEDLCLFLKVNIIVECIIIEL